MSLKKQLTAIGLWKDLQHETVKTQRKFLDNSVGGFGWRWKYIRPNITESEIDGVLDMLLSPRRDLRKLKDPKEQRKVNRYLKENSVYISLTTSPLRLKKIVSVLATLDLTHVKAINVVLPEEYGHKKEKYGRIPSIVKNFPKVKIIRVKKDLGPITKILPSVTRQRNKKNIVISVDDDVCYPIGFINELVYQKIVHYPKEVLSMGTSMPFFTTVKQMKKLWPESRKKRPFVDIVEGWSSILYTPKNVNDKCMKKLGSLSKKCLLSDDFVISYALAQSNVGRVLIRNRYAFDPHPYDYGTGEDALHAGRDLGGEKRSYVAHDDAINFEKYSDCLKSIDEYVNSVLRNKRLSDPCGFR